MFKIAMVLFGGLLGTFVRYYILTSTFLLIPSASSHKVLLINLIGGFLSGILYAIFEAINIPNYLQLFLFTGMLGGFTTFSAFLIDIFTYVSQGKIKAALLYGITTNIAAILLLFTGIFATKAVISLFR